jgi:hypothetical protein
VRQGGEIKLSVPTNHTSLGGATHGRGNYFLNADANLFSASHVYKTRKRWSVRSEEIPRGEARTLPSSPLQKIIHVVKLEVRARVYKEREVRGEI